MVERDQNDFSQHMDPDFNQSSYDDGCCFWAIFNLAIGGTSKEAKILNLSVSLPFCCARS